jgi:hypothetical protein
MPVVLLLCQFTDSPAVANTLCMAYRFWCLIFLHIVHYTIDSCQGSDFSTLYVRSTTSPLSRARRDSGVKDERFPDEIKNVKFSTLAWTKVSKGFFYQAWFTTILLLTMTVLTNLKRFPARDNDDPKAKIEMSRDRNAMLYYHIVGTPQCEESCSYPVYYSWPK